MCHLMLCELYSLWQSEVVVGYKELGTAFLQL